MVIQRLAPHQLRRTCDPNQFEFASTAELGRSNGIVGQPRGVSALEFGIAIRSSGYNIYVLGEPGTGRTTAIRRFLRERARHQKTPDDWVYVHNFKTPHQPRAIEFPAGQGAQFKRQMDELVVSIRHDVPNAFSTSEYEEEVDALWNRVELKDSLLMRDLERRARNSGFRIIKTAAGLTVAPVVDGQVMSNDQFALLTLDEQAHIDRLQQDLEVALDETLSKTRQIRQDARDDIVTLDRRVAEQAIAHHVDSLIDMYNDHEEVLLYLSEVHDDILQNLDDFRAQKEGDAELRRYEVNLFVDNSRTDGVPVIVEELPTYNNLIGRIEYELRNGAYITHFTNIKPGSLQRANGGYLVIDAADLLNDVYAWEALKRSIRSEHIVLRPNDTLDSAGRVLAKSIDPEPIPLDIKIILLGSGHLYYDLYELEEDFNELFKVKADFGTEMPRDREHELEYAHFVATRCHEERLPHFDRTAVARVIEFGSKLSGHQARLSARFGDIADLVREAGFWATLASRNCVTAVDVQRALDERIYRANKIETLIDEDFDTGMIMIATTGRVVGQVNALSVLDLGDYSFGRPSRITARTYAGSGGVAHIERETDMDDAVHNKGVLTLVGYLGGHYAHSSPLSFTASLTFEQNYYGVSGDSASLAELYALLSSLGEVPVRQGVAVTGSINQRGEVQPIGGANEKIEGFYRVCKRSGLSGDQGVIIPRSNIQDLMVSQEVVDAISEGRFNVWAVERVSEGMPILTDMVAGEPDEDGNYPANTVHGRIQRKLEQLAKKSLGEEDEEED